MFEMIDQARAIKGMQLAEDIAWSSDWRAKAWLLERLAPSFSMRLCRNCGQSSERAHLTRGAASSEVAVRIEILPDQTSSIGRLA